MLIINCKARHQCQAISPKFKFGHKFRVAMAPQELAEP